MTNYWPPIAHTVEVRYTTQRSFEWSRAVTSLIILAPRRETAYVYR